ncbi:uncharacterized protein LOC122245654 [Penaeus japonicus]|uniref:uncharacterized protein LOC122245654 n=1 Tax=Penaeus japonicus TaxID=27405 RepID=UPI001C71749D|nr:uncharacterized protein LOC122245654 [Penaeus japonicus]
MRTAILAVTVFLLARTRLLVSAWPQHIHPVGISAEELAALLAGDTSTAGARPLSAPPAPSVDSPQPASPADTSHISDEDLISLIAGGLPETDAPATVPPSFPLTSDSTPSSTGCSCVNSWQCPETNIGT